MKKMLNTFSIKKGIALSLVAASFATSAMAYNTDDIKISGFVNVVGGVNDVNPDKYVQGKTSKEYRGYDDNYDFQNESLAAIQFSANITEKMGATIQLIAQKDEVDDDIRMEWGYVSYDVTDELRVLAGRIRPSLFLYSDYLDVGYAYNWITPPDEVYYQAQITNLDGLNMSYNLELDDSTISLTMYGGNSSGKKVNPNDGSTLDFSYDNVWGAELSYTDDIMKIRAGYTAAKVTDNTTTGIPAPLLFDNSSAAFYGAGLSIDYEGLLIATEYIIRDMDETAAPDVTSYYGMIGYKIGNFTPSYTYAVADSDMEFENTGAATDAQVNGGRAANLDDRYSHTIGLRYELNAKAALKAEYNAATVTHSTYAGGTSLTEVDEDISTYRIALNIIF